MKKEIGIVLVLCIMISGLLLIASCAPVQTTPSSGTTAAAKPPAEGSEEDAVRQELEAAKEMFLVEDIYFEFDSSDLSAAAQDILRSKGIWLRNNPDSSAVIEGHCDERGTTEYNLALGDRRAETAKRFLINLGIAASRLTTTSYGEEMPADPGHTEAAWAKNRRAHFTLK